MQYLSYDDYKEIGGTLDETAFKRNIDRACGVIDGATHKRIEEMKEIPAQAKALCRDLVEYITANYGNSVQVSSRSQSGGPVSESESYVVKSKSDMDNDIDGIICDYLTSVNDDNGTPLLYRGAML